MSCYLTKFPKQMTKDELRDAALQLSELIYNSTYESEFDDSDFLQLSVWSHELREVYNEITNRKSGGIK